MSNVKLAIRVRPFTEKELKSEKERVSVVNVIDDNTVTITNIKVSLSGAGDSRERTRRYYADYTFDSSCPVTQPTYASQGRVFESIGRSVVTSVLQGCSACVLAYGQSATGKTHTMIGTEAQPGLIPRLCKALFEEKQHSYDYSISFLEIYNERVHDLLCGDALPTCHSLPRRRGNARKDLRVREHPQRGTYVQNLRRVSVQDVEALLSLVAEGVKRRRTAATKRNCTSSRSHALLEIATPHATLHLADLAGSEKASWEGCGGGRQKEGANINKSLVALSNVISALVNGGSGRGRFVPYRDSALTWLLKDCFTGGANTFIIATVSPSAACYGESASTLRWAARARQLPTPRASNNSSNVASRAVLQAQYNQLIAELTKNHIRYIPESGTIVFSEEHWKLRTNNDIEDDDLNKTAKIGNIMNIMRPKTDANNSESTASSVASGSSDVINAMEKNINITNEINKEMDKLFGPTLERTSSGDDLKVVAPLRHKRRQCRSQEVLAMDETMANETLNIADNIPSQSEMQINNLPNTEKQKVPNITILHDNQRAEIVASVTERLYSKLKKKEETAVAKVESIVDKKIVEPLSELKICTNARQRLMELSQKAIRNRRRIGIPAHTQTRRMVTRVRDQAIDVQTDLHSYILGTRRSYTLYRDVATETVPMTPRCKEKGVGPTGSMHFSDRSTGTKPVICKNSFMMTDVVTKTETCTQTLVVPPPRRKKRASLLKDICNHESRNFAEECSAAPVISINISQTYPVDSETQSSDDNSENVVLKIKKDKRPNVISTPDLLTNHSTSDTPNVIEIEPEEICLSVNVTANKVNPNPQDNSNSLDSNKQNEEFPDADDFILPRVSPNVARKVNQAEIKNMILGRNQNIYPYNIVLSPPKERDTKRLVKFKDIEVAQGIAVALEPKSEKDNEVSVSQVECNSDVTGSENDCPVFNDCESTYSDSTGSSKVDTDSFVWKKGVESKTLGSLRRNYVPVYKGPKYRTAKAKVLKEFLGMDDTEDSNRRTLPSYMSTENLNDNLSSSDSRDTSDYRSRRRKPYVNNKLYYNNDEGRFQSIERKLLDSCNSLEESVNKYENYLSNSKETTKVDGVEPAVRRPKEYLQHLVQLRREVVKAESDNTDSSVEHVSHK
ncbi:uncharacterized protein LOC142981002 [Anticarsia gemmatalis]|uniref:uncharacterized protein LOC142981002 n=1 Tax=Anticarsia gemmatalis TaxID=129554 RepID=UPI003F75A0F5